MSRDSIDNRLRACRWTAIHAGVYFTGAHLPTRRARLIAALLATAEGSVVSHTCAGAEWGVNRPSGVIHITAPGRSTRHLRGVTVHRPRRLDDADVTRRQGLPVTTLARTLLDLAEILPGYRLAKIFEEAERREILDLAAIEAVMARGRGRRGLKPLRRLLARHRALPITHEGLERELQVVLDEAGIPPPLTDVLIHGHEVDAYWPEAQLVVEVDSREFHAHWSAAERDRATDAHLLRHGIAVLRVTARRIREERATLVEDILIQLRLRGDVGRINRHIDG